MPTLVQAFQTQDQSRSLLNQSHAPSQQITDRPKCSLADIACGKDLQSKHLRDPIGIMLIIGMLDALVLLNAGRVSEHGLIPQSCRPSTNQYQLNVDSTAIVSIRFR